MAKILNTTALALFATLFVANASAQEMGKPDRIVLESKSGSVMTSAGGEYQTAPLGKVLALGESIMLADQAKATVVYYYLDSAGKVDRKCTERYTGANTYVIDDNCVAAAAWASDSGSAYGAGIIIGAGLLGGVLINSMGSDTPPGPLSTGPNGSIRHF